MHLFATFMMLLFSKVAFGNPVATFIKGSDGSAAHEYKNPCKVSVTANPAFTVDRELYLQRRFYTLEAIAKPALGWKAVKAEFTDSGGAIVVVPLNDSPLPVSFQIPLDLSSRSGGVPLFRVLFATLRVHPDGTEPEYQEYVSIRANVCPEATFWALDLDYNGLGDAWETQYFGRVGNDPNANPDGDSFTNLQEFLNRTNPNSYDAPLFSILAGDKSGALPNAVMNPPLTVRLTGIDGLPKAGAAVSFSILSGGGSLQSVQGTTNVDGISKATLKMPSTVGAVVKVRARTIINSVHDDLVFTATVGDPSQAPAAPSKPRITMNAAGVEAVVEWQDRSHNETAFYVERTSDNRTWVRRATLAPNTISYTDRGLIPELVYSYRVVAHNTAP